MSAPEDGVLLERADGVLTVTLHRESRRNALTRAMIESITAAVHAVAHDDGVRVLLLRSSGQDFCTGIDLGEANDRTGSGGGRPRVGHLQRGFPYGAHGMIRAFDLVQVPVVSAVRGWAAGVGNALALSADVVIADSSARFWVPMVRRGFTPDSGNSWLLPRLIGLARAKEMLIRGKPVDGPTAAAWGLVAECVEPADLDGAVAAVVDELRQAATVAAGLTRILIHRNLAVDLDAALQNEGIHEELAVRSDDFKEGIRSFTEKRDPRFTGR